MLYTFYLKEKRYKKKKEREKGKTKTMSPFRKDKV